jgi:D-tagatose-1,6-bisphosphate aldolase subunit GatZ/KbaZ
VTFALRETLWALDDIARQIPGGGDPTLKTAVLAAMRENPRHWAAYYTDAARRDFDLQYSLSDRIRYYWAAPAVQRACAALLDQLAGRALPLTLLSQYLPRQFAAVRAGRIANEAHAVLIEGVALVLRQYALACGLPAGGALPAPFED